MAPTLHQPRQHVVEQLDEPGAKRRHREPTLDAREIDDRSRFLRQLDLRALGLAEQQVTEPLVDHVHQSPVEPRSDEERLQLAQRPEELAARRAG